ncbi:hypothetical protein N7495_001488 [Penicillium taxi]|uniref:uncharacterized protein n=1 Tax=Penicillium taxi TaxID=168475 RepID=UPI002544D9C9|nr:uncharacterized protein N7495_001488 [Penicillium taxi]KAJ5908806.1 hypothetical protein N7495_001488 [Penicillium taxi]
MIRLFNRLYFLCVVAAFTVLYSAWFLTSRKLGDVVLLDIETPPTFDRRLVVFGDSWSDNEKEEMQGKSWTDWLCLMSSSYQENLAQTPNSIIRGKSVGSVVDKGELGLLNRLFQTTVPDFKTQVTKWLDTELHTQEGLTAEEKNLVSEDYDKATESVKRRIQKLVKQLDTISDRLGSADLKIILTMGIDVTFLPGFKDDSMNVEYKNAVRLVAFWNEKLREAASKWKKGYIYLFDTNEFVLDRIRDWQFYAAGIETKTGLGTNRDPGWDNVSDACVKSENSLQVMMSKDKQSTPCSYPEKYLFWNEMQLGPSAHHLMASAIYHGIDGVLINRKAPAVVSIENLDEMEGDGSA